MVLEAALMASDSSETLKEILWNVKVIPILLFAILVGVMLPEGDWYRLIMFIIAGATFTIHAIASILFFRGS